MPELILVRGVPGSGKSTFAEKDAAEVRSKGVPAVVVSADDWMVDEYGLYEYNYSRLPYCHTMCQRTVNLHMTKCVPAIYVANTFVRKWEADAYYALAKVWGYTVTVYRMTGEYKNVHGVPQDRVNIMRANMEIYPGEVYK